MRLRIDKTTFANALNEAYFFASAKSPIEILKYAKITTKGNVMKVEANNSKESMVKYLDMLECDEDKSFLLPVIDVSKYINMLNVPEIELETEEGAANFLNINFSSGSSSFSIPNADEYSSMGINDDEATVVDIPTAVLNSFITASIKVIKENMVRPQLNGMFMYIKDGELGFCATDTTAMIFGSCNPAGLDNIQIEWNTPASVLPLLLKATAKPTESELTTIKATNKHVSYRIGNTIFNASLVAGNFPNFRRVIPTNNPIKCEVNAKDMLVVVRRISQFCDKMECFEMNVKDMSMNLSTSNIDFGKKVEEKIHDIKCDSEIRACFSAPAFSVALGVFSNSSMPTVINYSDANRPILIENEGVNAKCVLMPMRLRQE